MNNSAVHGPQIVQGCLIEIVGEAVDCREALIRRIAAKEIIKLGPMLHFPKEARDLMMAMVAIANLTCRLLSPWTYFSEELASELLSYSPDGITFPALVHLVRLEETLFAWDWLPEQVRALGLAINPGEEVVWGITEEFVTIKDRESNTRRFYRYSS